MSMIDWLLILFLAITATMIVGLCFFLAWAYGEIRQKWTCEAGSIPAPSRLASSDGGTIR